MKTIPAFLLFASSLAAHDLATTDREVLRAHILEEWKRERGMTEVASAASVVQLVAAAAANAANAPQTAKAFLPFTKLDLRADGEFLYVGSNGLPDHNMMVGITAWQQQVPLPQPYFDDNAWRIPLKPVVAKEPAMIKGRFLRGAIALAVNGIPIFNPQNNRGELSYEIGELDQWGGHCGRADDYHYHIAPLHLQAQVGKGMPVAYALDGYPVYGLTEPDGSLVANLDECHGHDDAKIGYHYHASNQYPYVFGGFHGEVVEREEQVDPQPRAQGVREALQALRGAKITAFESTGKDSYKLSYDVNGDKRSVSYSIKADGTYPFHFDNGRDGTADEVYTARRQGGGGGGRPPGGGGPEGMKGKGKGKGQGKGGREGVTGAFLPLEDRPEGPGMAPIQGILDVNGDGVVTAQEFADNAKSNAAKKGTPFAEAMTKAKEQFTALDHNRDGKLDTPELDELAGNAPATGTPQPRGDEPPAREEMKKGGGGERGGKGQAFVALPDQPRSSDGQFMLNSPVVEDLQALPVEFTGDGDGISPPLAWAGAPAGTKGYALIMDHVTPNGDRKWYWTVYDIPGNASSLPKNVTDIGKLGTGFKGEIGYEPPMSKGPGAKTYVITLYALSEPLNVAGKTGREELITAMKGKVIANSSLRVVHSSGGQVTGAFLPRESDDGPGMARIPAQGKGGPPGLVKPSIADTIKLNVYADNWFMLYVNGRLVAVDSIQFTPHNVVSVDFLPEYPMTIAALAKDNADPKTGMEYGTSIGDAGLCIKFADGTVTNATWKAKNFFHGPVNSDTANPKVIQEPLPANWWATDFDDSTWKNAKEYTVEEVDPKQPYFDNDFEGAKFIWTDDIALDNTVIFRTKVEKPGWTPRWNTKPDLDVSGVPTR
ncbi:MAG: YHYH protein [Verrucomicrobiaceae bacterium]|nr:YHYH protein [Verrucomicrobiaceae bacterium]